MQPGFWENVHTGFDLAHRANKNSGNSPIPGFGAVHGALQRFRDPYGDHDNGYTGLKGNGNKSGMDTEDLEDAIEEMTNSVKTMTDVMRKLIDEMGKRKDERPEPTKITVNKSSNTGSGGSQPPVRRMAR